MLKVLLKSVARKVLKLFYPKYMPSDSLLIVSLRCLWAQKVLRHNGDVPWPVPKTTRIKGVENIHYTDLAPGISGYAYFDGRNGIYFGRNVWVGPNVSIISKNHNINDYTEYEEDEPIVIGDNVWLGFGSIILPGVKLGSHVVVAAGSVVSKSFEEDDILIGGIPAKVIKKLNKYGSRDIY